MKKKVRIIFLFVSFFLLMLFSTQQSIAQTLEKKFADKIVELVLKKDVNSIYSLASKEFKKLISLKQLRDLIENTISLYKGKVISSSIQKFEHHQNIDITEIWMKLNYDDGLWLLVGLYLKKENGKFSIWGLKLNACPKLATEIVKSYPYYNEVMKFTKKIFHFIAQGKLEKTMMYVSDRIKNKFGKEFIKHFLISMKGITIQKILDFKWTSAKDEYLYNLLFEGTLKKSPVNIGITIFKSKKGFEILDINIQNK